MDPKQHDTCDLCNAIFAMQFLHMARHGDGTEVFGTAWHGTAMPRNLTLMRTYVFCQAVGAQNAGVVNPSFDSHAL